MLQAAKPLKKATNLTLDVKVLEMARSLGMNLSQTVNELLAQEVKRLYWEKWAEDNKAGIAAHNARIAKEGLPLAKYRTFARSLGDGKKS